MKGKIIFLMAYQASFRNLQGSKCQKFQSSFFLTGLLTTFETNGDKKNGSQVVDIWTKQKIENFRNEISAFEPVMVLRNNPVQRLNQCIISFIDDVRILCTLLITITLRSQKPKYSNTSNSFHSMYGNFAVRQIAHLLH